MFYSNDLLGKKSPLGSIWMAAHHKRLPRHTYIHINVKDSCDQLMNPEIPQALRLQAILASGIVIVHNKKHDYLLEDCGHALQRVNTSMKPSSKESLNIDVAQTADITLADEEPLGQQPLIDLFPIFPSQLPQILPSTNNLTNSLHISDELFLMPSVPTESDTTGLVTGRGGMRRQEERPGSPTIQQYPEYDQMINNDYIPMYQDEMFDAPDIPGFDEMFAAQAGLFAAGGGGDQQQQQFGDDGGFDMPPPPLDGDGTEGNAAAAGGVNKKRRKLRKAKIDKSTLLDSSSMSYMFTLTQAATQQHQSEHLPAVFDHTNGSSSLDIDLPPATVNPGPASFKHSKVAPEYMEIWNEVVKVPEGQQMVKRGRRAGAAGGGEEQGGGLGGEEVLPNDGMQMDMPLDGGADWYAYDGMQQQYDGENIELERLRMALNGATPGGNDFLQLGATPGSKEEALKGSKRKRGGKGSADRDSLGNLSDKSGSEPGDARRLSDLLDGMWGPEEGDAGAVLPPLDEDQAFVGDGGLGGSDGMKKRLRSGSLSGKAKFASLGSEPLSQFQLLEESGHLTVPSGVPSAPPLERQTEVVFNELQSMLLSKDGPSELSLLDLSERLERLQASRLFYQILVCHSYGLIQATQEEPYEDISVSLPVSSSQ